MPCRAVESEALQVERSRPFELLGLVAVGLLVFALYSLFEARYRRLQAGVPIVVPVAVTTARGATAL